MTTWSEELAERACRAVERFGESPDPATLASLRAALTRCASPRQLAAVLELHRPAQPCLLAMCDGTLVDGGEQRGRAVLRLVPTGQAVPAPGARVEYAPADAQSRAAGARVAWPPDGGYCFDCRLEPWQTPMFPHGATVRGGEPITTGERDLRAVLAISGGPAAAEMLAAAIHAVLGPGDELAVRALADALVGARVEIEDPGDSGLEAGTRLSVRRFYALNDALGAAGRRCASAVSIASRLSELDAHADPA